MDMEILPTAWSVFGCGLVFVAGAALALKLGRVFGAGQKKAILLYLWHTLFCIIYLMYVLQKGGDAIMYFNTSLNPEIGFAFGTVAVRALTSIFTQWVGLSILGVFLVFNIFGFVGLVALDGTLRSVTKNQNKWVRQVAALIVFMPSMSFWSAAIGKDAISFMAAGLAVWASQAMGRRFVVIAIAETLMLAVRPLFSPMRVRGGAFGALMVFQRGVGIVPRLLIGAIAITSASMAIPLALEESNLGSSASAADVYEYIEGRQSYNMEGGGGVNISSMPLPLQIFTYLFRPLPIEAHSIPAFASAIDNVALLIITFLAIRGRFKGWAHDEVRGKPFLWIYSISVLVMLSLTTANLGISMRQKWMFIPMLMVLVLPMAGRTVKARAKPWINKTRAE